MSNFSTIPAGTLFVRETGRRYRQATSAEVIAAARDEVERTFKRDVRISDPGSVRRYLVHTMAMLTRETFRMILLDAQHQLLDAVDVSVGTIDAASVYPREVVKIALRAERCAAVIFAHQHPSGTPEPSTADRLLTDRLRQALALVDVRVLDHFVIGGSQMTSMAERGLL
ncbi:MAG TPA: JAB domain-containing protein [Vicinamibacterales bacterium]|nr:JAB domain-containing protein [Vicinamibacterales bacterium]